MLFKALKRAYYNMLFDIIRLVKSSSFGVFNFFFRIGANQSLLKCFMIGTALVSVRLLSDAFILQRKSNFSQPSVDLHGRYLV